MSNKFDFIGTVCINLKQNDKTFNVCKRAIFWAGPTSYVCEKPMGNVFTFQGRVKDVELEDLQIMCFASPPKNITNANEIGDTVKDIHVGTVRLKLVDVLSGKQVCTENNDPIQGDVTIEARVVPLSDKLSQKYSTINAAAIKSIRAKKLMPLTQNMLNAFNEQQQLQANLFIKAVKQQGLKFNKDGVLDDNAVTVYANTVVVPVVHINQCVNYKLPMSTYDKNHMFGFVMSTMRIAGIPCQQIVTPAVFERFLQNIAPHASSFMRYASDLKLNPAEHKLFQSEDIAVVNDMPYKKFNAKAFEGDCEDLSTIFRCIVYNMKDFCKKADVSMQKDISKDPLFRKWKPDQIRMGLEQCRALSVYLDKMDTHLILMTAYAPNVDASGKGGKKDLCGHCAAGITFNNKLMVAELTAPVRFISNLEPCNAVPNKPLSTEVRKIVQRIQGALPSEQKVTEAMYYNMQAKTNAPSQNSKAWLHISKITPGVFWNVAGVIGNYIPVDKNVMGMPLCDINNVEDLQSVSFDAPADLAFYVKYATPPPANVIKFYSKEVSPPHTTPFDASATVPIAYITDRVSDEWLKGDKRRFTVNIGDHVLAVQHVDRVDESNLCVLQGDIRQEALHAPLPTPPTNTSARFGGRVRTGRRLK